ncbi:MAG: [Bacteroidaceae bacterium]|nr:[FeFe] hydrogenase H-cluster maturation GTPase HydF [Bacteroidaceae bacterium]
MSETARSNRYHIAIFGRRNAGKSSLVNAIAGQDVSIVSDVPGTTTDVVWKNIELPGIGAAVIGDTAGYDDEGTLGAMRIERTQRVAQRVDLALLMLGGNPHDAALEKGWKEQFEKADIPVICLMGRSDETSPSVVDEWRELLQCDIYNVSSKTKEGIDQLLAVMAAIYKRDDNLDDITHSLVGQGDTVLLVMPQDKQSPKGRLIQPQVQTLRNLLDKHCLALCCAPEELPQMLSLLSAPPSLIITDSQVFAQVKALTPPETKLTSFSVLMARHKGDIEAFRAGAEVLVNLPSTARILIAEACTHIPQNEDIGRVKLPMLLRKRLGEGLTIDVVGGNDFPDDLSAYDIIIHCGACMFTRRHVMSRVRRAKGQHIPITNYGIAIAALTGILDRVVY